MKHFLFLGLSMILTLGCSSASAITFSDDRFTYETKDATTAKITKYNGSEASIIFPTTVAHDGVTYQINEIYGLSSCVISSNNNTVEELYFPAGITSIKSVTDESTSLKNVIIEDGTQLTSVSRAFYIYFSYYDSPLESVTVLTSCNFTYFDFTANASELLLKVGEIQVYYQGNETGEPVQIYLYSHLGASADRHYGANCFKTLLTGLQRKGKDISKITKIDLSNMPNHSGKVKAKVKFTFDSENYDPSSELSNGAEVITGTKTYTSGIKEIADLTDFTAPQFTTCTNISYTRQNAMDWNSVCLPFDIKESDFGTDACKIYTVASATTETIDLKRVESEETVIPAGTPCFIKSTVETWNLSLSDVSLSSDVTPQTITIDENWSVVGSFTTQIIGSGKYKLASNGSEFGITSGSSAKVFPFRCYIAPNGSNHAPTRMYVNLDDEASIMLVPDDEVPQRVKLFDLMGRPRKEGTQGIFIQSTR